MSPFVKEPPGLFQSHFPFSSSRAQPDQPSQEALLSEIKRLRERLVTLEAENASMSLKLSHQQWEMENRLAEIELHICSGGNTPGTGTTGTGANSSSIASSGSGDENERNKESII